MKAIEELLISHNYSNIKGFYSMDPNLSQPTEADKVWSEMAQDNPIRAAAATPTRDPFAKYPTSVEAAIPDETGLVLDAGCGYGRVAIPLLRKKNRDKDSRCGCVAGDVELFPGFACERRVGCGYKKAIDFSAFEH